MTGNSDVLQTYVFALIGQVECDKTGRKQTTKKTNIIFEKCRENTLYSNFQ